MQSFITSWLDTVKVDNGGNSLFCCKRESMTEILNWTLFYLYIYRYIAVGRNTGRNEFVPFPEETLGCIKWRAALSCNLGDFLITFHHADQHYATNMMIMMIMKMLREKEGITKSLELFLWISYFWKYCQRNNSTKFKDTCIKQLMYRSANCIATLSRLVLRAKFNSGFSLGAPITATMFQTKLSKYIPYHCISLKTQKYFHSIHFWRKTVFFFKCLQESKSKEKISPKSICDLLQLFTFLT